MIPAPATSWQVFPKGKTIDFALRKGTKFHSGDPLVVKNVVFTFVKKVFLPKSTAYTADTAFVVVAGGILWAKPTYSERPRQV